jgi:hypothetical protein
MEPINVSPPVTDARGVVSLDCARTPTEKNTPTSKTSGVEIVRITIFLPKTQEKRRQGNDKPARRRAGSGIDVLRSDSVRGQNCILSFANAK